MKVALTGGTGVVGSAVLRHLVAAGHEVKALVRSDKGGVAIAAAGARPHVGDLRDVDSLIGLVNGTDWVFNVAGVNELCSADPKNMWNANVEGPMLLLQAANRASVKRLIQTSSVVTLGAGGSDVADEWSKHRGHFISEYERTKTIGERLVFRHAGDVEVVAVNPSSVQGPGRATGTGRLILAVAKGTAKFAVDTTVSIVDIDDCAAGHLLAAERGIPGERYVLSGPTASVREITRIVGRVAGHNRRPLFLRPAAIQTVAPLLELLPSELGVCEESLRVLLEGHSYSNERSVNELTMPYASLEETLTRTVGWFRSEGLLA